MCCRALPRLCVSRRREGIVHKKNEVYIDVLERVNLLVSSNGTILRADVTGQVMMRTFLTGMPDCKVRMAFCSCALPPPCSCFCLSVAIYLSSSSSSSSSSLLSRVHPSPAPRCIAVPITVYRCSPRLSAAWFERQDPDGPGCQCRSCCRWRCR